MILLKFKNYILPKYNWKKLIRLYKVPPFNLKIKGFKEFISKLIISRVLISYRKKINNKNKWVEKSHNLKILFLNSLNRELIFYSNYLIKHPKNNQYNKFSLKSKLNINSINNVNLQLSTRSSSKISLGNNAGSPKSSPRPSCP
jgi:hypothetical protein